LLGTRPAPGGSLGLIEYRLSRGCLSRIRQAGDTPLACLPALRT